MSTRYYSREKCHFEHGLLLKTSPEWSLVHFNNLITYPKNKQRVCSIKLGDAFDWKSVFKIANFLIFVGTQNPKTDLFTDFLLILDISIANDFWILCSIVMLKDPSLKFFMQIFVANASTKYKRDRKYQFAVFAPFVGFGLLCSPT